MIVVSNQYYVVDLLQTQLDYEDCDVGDHFTDLVPPVSGTDDFGPFKKVWVGDLLLLVMIKNEKFIIEKEAFFFKV